MADISGETQRAWDVHCYAENLFSYRMNYGMVAQSMLMVSFVTLFVYQSQVPVYSVVLEFVVGGLGLLYSVFQYLRGRELTTRIRFLQNTYLVPNDPVFAAYMQIYKNFPRRIKARACFARIWARMEFLLDRRGFRRSSSPQIALVTIPRVTPQHGARARMRPLREQSSMGKAARARFQRRLRNADAGRRSN